MFSGRSGQDKDRVREVPGEPRTDQGQVRRAEEQGLQEGGRVQGQIPESLQEAARRPQREKSVHKTLSS